jgi:AMP-binding enzyme
VSYCDENKIDVVNVTPTYAHLLIEEGLLDNHRPALVLLGGEAVSETVWSRLRDTDGTYGYNLYGPTEYTINTLGGGTDDSDTPTVGKPIWNTRAYIVDTWLRPVPDGVGRRALDLRRTRRAGQPARQGPCRARRRAGADRGVATAEVGRLPDGDPGRAQGRWRVPACRSGPAGPAGRGVVNLFHSHRETLYRPVGRRHLKVGHAWSFSFDAS